MKKETPIQLLENYIEKNGTSKLEEIALEFDEISYEGASVEEYIAKWNEDKNDIPTFKL